MSDLKYLKELKDKILIDYDLFHSDKDNLRMLKNNGKDGEEKYTGSTFLYIRGFEGDNGSRPIPSGTVHWRSPDMTLIDNNGPLVSSTVQTNTDYKVRVTVTNDGDHDCHSATVELFLSNPSIGFSRAASRQIGIQNVSIPGHSKVEVDFPFVASHEDSGHKCLFARVYSFANNDYPDDFDNFLTREDRHIGQRNLSIVHPGETFQFNIVREKPDGKRFEVVLTQIFKELPFMEPYILYKEKIELGEFQIKVEGQMNTIIKSKYYKDRFIKKEIELKQTEEGRWIGDSDAKFLTMMLQIPKLKLSEKQAIPLELSIINSLTKQAEGGITLLITN